MRQNDYLVKNNQPKTLSCMVHCSLTRIFSGCNITPDWFVRIRTDNYTIHSLSKDKREDVLNELTFELNNETLTPITCDNRSVTYFNITFSSIGIYDEVLVSCGLRRENNTVNKVQYDQFLAVVKKCKLNII